MKRDAALIKQAPVIMSHLTQFSDDIVQTPDHENHRV
jgi:hypothetical protein